MNVITMAHGSGGKTTHAFIKDTIFKHLDNDALRQYSDSALLNLPASDIAYTTDSFVIQPLFFPGGDIGRLAVCGTVNDLAMCGARPLALSVGLILEEGFPLA